MKNLFSVAKCFAIKESDKSIDINHLIKAAIATTFDKSNRVYKILSKYATDNQLEEFSTGKGFIEVKTIFDNLDDYPEKVYSDLVNEIKKELEDASFATEETIKIFFISDITDTEDEILDLFSKKLKSLKENTKVIFYVLLPQKMRNCYVHLFLPQLITQHQYGWRNCKVNNIDTLFGIEGLKDRYENLIEPFLETIFENNK